MKDYRTKPQSKRKLVLVLFLLLCSITINACGSSVHNEKENVREESSSEHGEEETSLEEESEELYTESTSSVSEETESVSSSEEKQPMHYIEVTEYLTDLEMVPDIVKSSKDGDFFAAMKPEFEAYWLSLNNPGLEILTIYGIRMGSPIEEALEHLQDYFAVAKWERESDNTIMCYFYDRITQCNFDTRYIRFTVDEQNHITEWKFWIYITEEDQEVEEKQIWKFLDIDREKGIYDYDDVIKDYASILAKEVSQEYLGGVWETNGMQPYPIHCTFDESYKYNYTCDYDTGKYLYRDKNSISYEETNYGYYITITDDGYQTGYRLYKDDLQSLECIGNGAAYSDEGYSGSSSLTRVEE